MTSEREYLAAIRARVVATYGTLFCPECDVDIEDMGAEARDGHVIIGGRIVIGCEGYWTADPADLGLPASNWTPTTERKN